MIRRLPFIDAPRIRLVAGVDASMSKTDLLLQCSYWASPATHKVPEPTEVSSLNYALRFGRGFHLCAEIHLKSYGRKKPNFNVIAKRFEIEPDRLEHFYRRMKEYVDKLLKDRGWADQERLVEKKMVYDPFADTMRFLESTKERDYSDRKSTEFPGTGDLAVIPSDTKRPLMVLDWKSGQSTYDAQDNGQLLSLSLGLSRHLQRYEAIVFIVRIDEDFIEPSEGFLNRKMLDEHRENLRQALKSALSKTPAMRPGLHCSRLYCNAITVCPAHAGPLSLRDAVEGVLTMEQKAHQYARYQAAKKLVEKIGDFWHRDIEMNGPFFAENGGHVNLRSVSKENLSKASIRRAMNPIEAEALINQLREAGAIETNEYKELHVFPASAGKKPK